jgi:nucleoporin NUP82
MTTSLQLVAVELSYRVQEEPPTITSESDRLNVNQAPGYIPLLTPPPFVPPPPLDAQKGLAKNARIALPPDIARGKELEITPDTLRFLGQTVQSHRGEIRDMVKAANVVQGRLELQLKELSRELGKLSEIERNVEADKKNVEGGLAMRLERAREKQKELLSRLDRVLQRLMDSHQPVLSTYEKQWFEELGRLEVRISKDKAGSGKTLQARLDQVRLSSSMHTFSQTPLTARIRSRLQTKWHSYDLSSNLRPIVSCLHRLMPRRSWAEVSWKGCKGSLPTSE